MTRARTVSRIETAPPPAPGFIGAGHTAVEVVGRGELADRDPFVFLMDDRLDIPERRVIGGPHPHAGHRDRHLHPRRDRCTIATRASWAKATWSG